MKTLKHIILGALVIAGAWRSQAVTETGVTVNGTDVAIGDGDGWTFADGILSLTNAQDYVLAGTNTAGAVRVEVTANANVTLASLKLTGVEASGVFTFESGAGNATLTLAGDNVVYNEIGDAAVLITAGARVTAMGSGSLVGSGTTTAKRCVCIRSGGSFVLNGATIRDYRTSALGGAILNDYGSFTLYSGTVKDCHCRGGGGFLANSGGTSVIYGGSIVGCTATDAACIAAYAGTCHVYGGYFGYADDNAFVGSNSGATVCIHGAVIDTAIVGDPAYLFEAYKAAGTECVTVGNNKIIGQGVTTNLSAQLTGGTYAFCPTNAEYVAAGVALIPDCVVEKHSDTKYEIVVDRKGVTVNGVDVGYGSGEGWTFANGVLTLANARDYLLAGTNTAGEVRVSVTANATVTIRDLKLVGPDSAPSQIRFYANGRLILEGTNEIYANQGAFSIVVDGSLTIDGSGELVGGASAGIGARAVWSVGTLILNGGTIRGYSWNQNGSGVFIETGSFTMNGGTIRDCHEAGAGGAVYNKGTFTMNGGCIRDCSASSGGAVYNNKSGGHTGVFAQYGGVIADCSATSGAAYIGFADGTTGRVYGSVWDAAPDAGLIVSGSSAIQVGENWIVGSNVTAYAGAKLTGGTYTFCPTNAEYVAAGVALADNRQIVKQSGTPATYQVLPILSTVTPQTVANASVKVYTNEVEITSPFKVAYGAEVTVVYTANTGYEFADGETTATATFAADAEDVQVPEAKLPVASLKKIGVMVNGVEVANGHGEGWVFEDGILSLTNAQDYVLAGTNTAGEVRVEVTANANVTLASLKLTGLEANVFTFASGAGNATLTLSGDNVVYAKRSGYAAVLIKAGAVTAMGSGSLVGSGTTTASRCVGIQPGGSFTLNGATIRDYRTGAHGSAILNDYGSFTLYSGTVKDCYASGGGGFLANAGTSVVYGGSIVGCTANDAAFIAALKGTCHVYGGYFGYANDNAFVGSDSGATVCIHGAVIDTAIVGDPAYRIETYKASEAECVTVGNNKIIGQGVTTNLSAQLTGGTYTFCPTNAEYVAAGVALADNRQIVKQSGTPATYQVLPILSTVTPQTVANASVKVYTNEVEITSPFKVAYGAEVTVVYTANTGYEFADGETTATATFAADAEEVQVPEEKLPVASLKKTGVTVDGVEVANGHGEGWVFEDGILSLTNAQDYVLAGTNTAGAVRVNVTANATVTIRDIKLVGPDSASDQIRFSASGRLILEGTNEVYAKDGAASIAVHGSLTIDGNGELVGGASAGIGARGIWSVGTLVLDGGTIRGYSWNRNGSGVFIEIGSFTMNGGVIRDCHETNLGGAVYNKGTFTMNGGLVCDCSASSGGAVYNNNLGGHTGVFTQYGGVMSNCSATTGAAYVGLAEGTTVLVYGSVCDAAPDAGLVVSGSSATQVGENWIVGSNVTAYAGAQLTGGTYTFCPTNAEYVAAGVALDEHFQVSEQATVPVTWTVERKAYLWCLTVNGDWADGTLVTLQGLDGYSTNEVVAAGGKICLWLTNGSYDFLANGKPYVATIVDADATAETPNIRLTQADGTTAHDLTLEHALTRATNGATLTLLADLTQEGLTKSFAGLTYTLDGNGHTLRLDTDLRIVFSATDGAKITLANVRFDGAGTTNALASAALDSFLTLTNCVVTGFATTGRSPVSALDGSLEVFDTTFEANAVGDGCLLTAMTPVSSGEGAPGLLIDGLVATNNACKAVIGTENNSLDPLAVQLLSGVVSSNALILVSGMATATPDFITPETIVTINGGTALVFAEGVPGSVTLEASSAFLSEGDLVIANALDQAIAAENVRLLNCDFIPVGDDGNIRLAAATSFPYAARRGEAFAVFETFGQALAGGDGTNVSLVRNLTPWSGLSAGELAADLTIGAETNVVLRTVLRDSSSGTDVTWDGATTNLVTLKGTLTVAGRLKFENVGFAGTIVLNGGVVEVGSDFDLTNATVCVDLAAGLEPSEETAIVSSLYSGEELMRRFQLKADGLVFRVVSGGLVIARAQKGVARFGGTLYDTFNAAVQTATATGGGVIDLVTTVTNGVSSGSVKFGTDVQVPTGKVLTVRSIRLVKDGQSESVVENPTEPSVFAVDGCALTLGEGARMAFTNVAFNGTLTLKGAGLLDLAEFGGTMLVKPTHIGLIATNATDRADVRLGTGATGQLVRRGSGLWWLANEFSARFVQTGNGAGIVEINDYGYVSTNLVSGVMNGSTTVSYTTIFGTPTNFTFGVVSVHEKKDYGIRVVLPPKEIYASDDDYPVYVTGEKMDGTAEFETEEDDGLIYGSFESELLPKNASAKRDDSLQPAMLYVCNYGEPVLLGTYDIIASEEDADSAVRWSYQYLVETEDPESEFRKAVDGLENIMTAATVVSSLVQIGRSFLGCTVVAMTTAVNDIVSTIWHLSADLYVDDGMVNGDYYCAKDIDDACAVAIYNGKWLHLNKDDVKLPPYTLTGFGTRSVLMLDGAGAPYIKLDSVAALILGFVPKDPLSKLLASLITQVVMQVLEFVVHEQTEGYVSHNLLGKSETEPVFTIGDGLTLQTRSINMSQGKSKKNNLLQPLFRVKSGGTLEIVKPSKGDGDTATFSGYKSVGPKGLVYVCNGGTVRLNHKLTAYAAGLTNIVVEAGGQVNLVQKYDGSKVGISGQTASGAVFANASKNWSTTNDYKTVFLNDAIEIENAAQTDASKKISYTVAIDSLTGAVSWSYVRPEDDPTPDPKPDPTPTPVQPLFDGIPLSILLTQAESNQCANIYGQPTNGVKGCYYYVESADELTGPWSWCAPTYWQATADGPVAGMAGLLHQTPCDRMKRFFRIRASAEKPVAQ